MDLDYSSALPGGAWRGIRIARGFTLIELMITVAVIGILVALAFPSYQSSIRKSRRTDAKTALLDMASRQERFFTTNNVYTVAPANLGYSGTFPVAVPSASTFNYGITVSAISSTNTSYTLTAAPNGNQALDPCATYVLNELGQQSNSGGTTPSVECWK